MSHHIRGGIYSSCINYLIGTYINVECVTLAL
jgi:hypothetical protein